MEDIQSQIDELNVQIAELKQSLDSLSNSATIDRNLETALQERLGTPIDVSTAGATVVVGSFPVTVPANPSGTLTVRFRGVTYNLLYK